MDLKWLAIGVGAYLLLTRSSSSAGTTSNGYLPNSTPPGASTLPGIMAPPTNPLDVGGCVGRGIFC